jgi:hypothetical protein
MGGERKRGREYIRNDTVYSVMGQDNAVHIVFPARILRTAKSSQGVSHGDVTDVQCERGAVYGYSPLTHLKSQIGMLKMSSDLYIHTYIHMYIHIHTYIFSHTPCNKKNVFSTFILALRLVPRCRLGGGTGSEPSITRNPPSPVPLTSRGSGGKTLLALSHTMSLV